ncbi:MAG: trigger factor [Pseudomonadota bacterium]|jgi:trigger factor|uniref:trigger factor n=1 Tax=unclassified Polaromonas TaxID=2638319 RepID=UPI000BCEE100|nr:MULTISPECIES: trigger factor [unclassified Polaromonas]MDO8373604.1 trigger factor [Polaromonas sp.]OYY34982.1 MAG: trigger factor [Polaromonas sp. 35-63-35]OYZ20122.1 MAG: trigger factor [Polaromonas sp. 16-63-31]OYZ77875.1 MAG: trigger factor [Polaromonas sp. 24-63-21]OZA49385.1 MAG: trigger factor [Polaromonas sp. 17-63-33]
MAVTVETLEKLERKITLTLPVGTIQSEVDSRLKRLARTVKMDGFRPGKVPMNVVAQRYGYSVHYEVMNDKVGEAFSVAANEAKLRVAGQPRISEKEGAPEGELAFDAIFEVYPEVKIGDLASAEVEKITAEVTDEAIDKTVDILRKQRRTFAQRAIDAPAQDGDRVTIDFEGKIDGEPFAGGKAEAFQFLVGEGQMLKEFEDAVRGMKSGESKTFPLNFPADYHGKDVAGKQADFMVTVKKIEAAHLPEVNEALAKSLGIADATVEGLRADIRKNLEREVKFRLLARNKNAVMDALLAHAELDVPQAIVQSELDRMVEGARADLKQRGIKDADKAPIPDDIFRPQAEKRVRLGLVVAELTRTNDLFPKTEQVKAHVEELASSYEKPEDVVRWYFSDEKRMAEVESVVIENNVTNFVLGKAKIVEKSVPFDELMAQN